jgi:hypothetical protein
MISRVKVHFECKLDYHFTYHCACVSSTLVLLVLITLQRKLSFQGAMSFSPEVKICFFHVFLVAAINIFSTVA